nr:MAG TPA: hypothetical protein [Caudoviricetes sp.]
MEEARLPERRKSAEKVRQPCLNMETAVRW